MTGNLLLYRKTAEKMTGCRQKLLFFEIYVKLFIRHFK